MKRQILLLAITAAAISSCTTAYKTGQTPDDVYYSPARPQDEYVRVQEDDNKYRSDDDYYDDRYLRMKVQNHYRWDYFNDWYSYDRYSYRYNYYTAPYWNYYGNYWNPYTSWNYYYNPYFSNAIVYVNPKGSGGQTNYVKPRDFNLNGYTNNNYNNTNSFTKGNYKPTTVNRPVYNNSNGTGLSNTLKQIFSGGNNNNYNNSSYSQPTRTYTPSSSSGSSGGSSGSSSSGGSSGNSGGGVSRPTRGGN